MRGKKLLVGVAALVVLGGTCGTCCLVGALGNGSAARQQEAINRAREVCRPPMVFRQRAGTTGSQLADWECAAPEIAAMPPESPAPTAPATPDRPRPSAVPEETVPVAGAQQESEFWQQPMGVMEENRPCPEPGLWALFRSFNPGGSDEFARRRFEGERETVASAARARVYDVRVQIRSGLRQYDFARHGFPVEISAMSTCRLQQDGLRETVRVSLTEPRRGTNLLTGGAMWEAERLVLHLDVPEAEAQAFRDANRRGFVTRVAVRLGEVADDDRPLVGAGVVVRGDIQRIRLESVSGAVVYDGPPPQPERSGRRRR